MQLRLLAIRDLPQSTYFLSNESLWHNAEGLRFSTLFH